MTLRLVDLQQCAAQPWRNGGGRTRELLAWPTAADWRLRASVAHIDRSGPFSPFPGVQRCFAVLHGRGVRLDLPAGPVTVGPDDEPLAFDGGDAPLCSLIDGATEDLNLMAMEDAGHARMRRAAPDDAVDGPTRWRGVFTLRALQLRTGEQLHTLPAQTLAWTDDPQAPPWRLHGDSATRAWILTLEG